MAVKKKKIVAIKKKTVKTFGIFFVRRILRHTPSLPLPRPIDRFRKNSYVEKKTVRRGNERE